jgi:hypothetical protein
MIMSDPALVHQGKGADNWDGLQTVLDIYIFADTNGEFAINSGVSAISALEICGVSSRQCLQ